MPINRHPAWGEFVKAFNTIARHRHRYEVFRDFVTMSAAALHNAIRKDEKLETEYLATAARYKQDELSEFSALLAKLVLLLETEPRDVLGPLYMELELGNTNTGQFFTPHEVSELMARVTYGDELKTIDKPFITVCEPACGAGGMVLAFVNVMLSHGHNPAQRLWVQAQDIDRTAALMCYLQMALWHIPGVVIVGNTLAMEVREVWYTPAHYLGFWHHRLEREWGRAEDHSGDSNDSPAMQEEAQPVPINPPNRDTTRPPMLSIPKGQSTFDF